RRETLHDREVETQAARIAERPADGRAIVVGVADDEPPDRLDAILLEETDRAGRLVLGLTALGGDVERGHVGRLGVLDSHEDRVEARARHLRGKRRILGDTVHRRLHDVAQMGEAGRMDLLAQLLQARYVDRDVVVDEEDAAYAAPRESAQVLEDPRDGKPPKRPAVHAPDRAEGAGKRTAARRLGHVEDPIEVEGAVVGARLAPGER